MKEKKFAHAFERRGVVYVSGSVNGRRYRLSTGKQASSPNLKWVDANWKACIESILSSEEVVRVGKEETVKEKFASYGRKSLDANSGTRRELTNKEYNNVFEKRIVPFFGEMDIKSILSTDLKRWQSALVKEGLSGGRIQNIRSVFYSILSDAVLDGIIPNNPFDNIQTVTKEDPEINPFTLNEVEMLINTAQGWFKNMLILAFFTGMRTGEMMALRWEHIDFDKDLIRVRLSRRSGITSKPKTRSSIRDIIMLPRVKEALKQQFLLTGLKNKDVFLTQQGISGFQFANALTERHWHPLCQKMGLEKRDFYHTRHTFATLMISHGEDILWVANTMGHKDITMVMKKYAKYRVDNTIKRASFLDIQPEIGTHENGTHLHSIGTKLAQ